MNYSAQILRTPSKSSQQQLAGDEGEARGMKMYLCVLGININILQNQWN